MSIRQGEDRVQEEVSGRENQKMFTMTHEYQGNKQTATKENMSTGARARRRGSRRRNNLLNSMHCRIYDSVMRF